MSKDTQKDDADERGLRADSLRNVSVINDEGLLYGLPSKLFIGGAALSVALMMVLTWYTGVAFAAIYFPAMYAIHKDDPLAFQGWMDAIFNRRKDRWCGGKNKGRSIYFINDKEK